MKHSNRHLIRRCASVLALAAVVSFATDSSAAAPQAEVEATQPTPAATMGDDSFDVAVSNGKAKVGESGSITVTVTAAEGYKANKEYPNKIKNLAVNGAADLAATTVSGIVRANTINFTVQATPTSAGRHAVTGEIRFSVCNAESCSIKKVPLDATITGE